MGEILWIIITGAVEFFFDALKRNWKKPHKIMSRETIRTEIRGLEDRIIKLRKALEDLE